MNLLLKAETGFPHSDVQRMKSSETNVEACKLSKTSGVGLTPIISLDLKSEGALYPDKAGSITLRASNSNEKSTPKWYTLKQDRTANPGLHRKGTHSKANGIA